MCVGLSVSYYNAMPDFEYLGLCPELLRSCEEQRWNLPTPVQDEAIPLILGGGDVMVAAETGSGKTAAFALPILQVTYETMVARRSSSKSAPQAKKAAAAAAAAPPARKIKLNVDDRDPLFAIDPSGLVCQSRHEKNWNGCRATVGTTGGKVYYEARCEDEGICRVGWSTLAGKFNLGTCKNGWGFGGTGMKSNGRKFEKYGVAYTKGDVVGVFLDLESKNNRTVSFSVNGKKHGVAYKLTNPKLTGPFFPACVLKNAEMTFNFGATRFAFPPDAKSGYVGLMQNGASGLVSNEADGGSGGNGGNGGGDLKDNGNNGPMALVIEPTRDLAEQTHKAFVKCSKFFRQPTLNSCLICGGSNASKQIQALRSNNVNIVTGTPGRVADMVKSGKLKLHDIRFFVMDEADQICGDKEGLETIMKIFSKLPKKTAEGTRLQVSFFSATLHGKDIKRLSEQLCFQPTWVDLKGEDSVPETVHHFALDVAPGSFLGRGKGGGKKKKGIQGKGGEEEKFTDGVHAKDNAGKVPGNSNESKSEHIKRAKYRALRHLIDNLKMDQCLIFCRTNVDCDNLEKYLIQIGGGGRGFSGKFESGKENPYSCVVVAGFRQQQERRQNLQAFKDGDVRFLICTDVAARGIDINGLPFVINFTLPDKTENYIHRIGRVGRAGKLGLAISLVGTMKEKVWYHANCKNRGRGCTNTNLVSKRGCCIWYDEPTLFKDVEKRVGHKIERELPKLNLEQYGEEKKETAGKRSEHIERIRPAVQELDQIAKSAQIQWLQMGALFDGIALKHNKQKKPKVTPQKRKKPHSNARKGKH